MIVDASAVLAIILAESEAPVFAQALAGAAEPRMSAVNFLEVAIRIDRENSIVSSRHFDDFMAFARIAVEPVSLSQARLARLAYAQFGKGRHPAGLNLGDCFAYALARETGLPLLFKGNDFPRTDVRPAV